MSTVPSKIFLVHLNIGRSFSKVRVSIKFCLKPYKITKSLWLLTFSELKTFWSIARHHCWLLRVPTDLDKCLTIYFGSLSAFENFLSPHERRALILKFWFLSKLCPNFASEELLKPWNLQNHQILTFSTLKIVSSVVRCHQLLLLVAMDLN